MSFLLVNHCSATNPRSAACADQDPHLRFAFGGSADFRGRHNALYNFLSAPGLALNIKTEDSTFKMHGGKLTVDGSFMTEAHLTAVSLPKRKFANVSFWAAELNEFNTGWRVVNGTCGGHYFKLGQGGRKTCEEMSFVVGYSTATWTTRDWVIQVHGNHVNDRVSGPEHRLDISLSAKGSATAASLPHGLVGQSFATVGLPRLGRKDVYPASGHIRTESMAEGAIDGEAHMYEVSSAFETRFAFSRFATVPASASSLLPHTDAPDAALAPAPTAAFEIPGRRLADECTDCVVISDITNADLEATHTYLCTLAQMGSNCPADPRTLSQDWHPPLDASIVSVTAVKLQAYWRENFVQGLGVYTLDQLEGRAVSTGAGQFSYNGGSSTSAHFWVAGAIDDVQQKLLLAKVVAFVDSSNSLYLGGASPSKSVSCDALSVECNNTNINQVDLVEFYDNCDTYGGDCNVAVYHGGTAWPGIDNTAYQGSIGVAKISHSLGVSLC